MSEQESNRRVKPKPPPFIQNFYLSKIHFSVTTITVYFCVQLCFIHIITYDVYFFILFISVLFGEFSVVNIFCFILPHWSSRLHIISWLFRRMFMSILFQLVFMTMRFFVFIRYIF